MYVQPLIARFVISSRFGNFPVDLCTTFIYIPDFFMLKQKYSQGLLNRNLIAA